MHLGWKVSSLASFPFVILHDSHKYSSNTVNFTIFYFDLDGQQDTTSGGSVNSCLKELLTKVSKLTYSLGRGESK